MDWSTVPVENFVPKMSVKSFVRKLSFKKSKSKQSPSSPTAAEWATTQGSGNDPRSPLPHSLQPDVLNPNATSLYMTQQQPSFSSFSPTTTSHPLPSSFLVSSPPTSNSFTPAAPLSDWIYQEIVLERRGRGLGFTLAGGIDRNDGGDGSIYVTKIIEGGVAANDGRLRVNDTILSVNGTSYVGLTHRESVDCLKATPNIIHLKIKRYRPTKDDVTVIDLYRPDGRGLGFTVAGGIGSQEIEGDDGIFVTRVTEGGVADQDGRLSVGDRLLAVNDVSMTYVSHEEAVETLMGARGRVRLLVAKTNIHTDHFTAAVPLATGLTSTFENGFETVAAYNGSYVPRQAPPFRLQLPPTSAQSPPLNQSTPVMPPTMYASHLTVGLQSQNSMSQFPAPMLQSTHPTQHSVSPMLYVPRTGVQASQPLPELIPRVMTGSEMPSFVKEQRQITIRKNLTAGLGFNIVGGSDGVGIFVSAIIPGGAADLNGQLRKGDQLLSVNNVDLREASHQEATMALKAVGETALITTQYRPEEFNLVERKTREFQQKMRAKPNDLQGAIQRKAMFIRALFDYDASTEADQMPGRGMSFSFGDILHVISPGGNDEWWQARRVLPWSDVNSGSGFIPGRRRIEMKPFSQPKFPFSGGKPDTDSNRENVPLKSRRRSFILSNKLQFGKSKEKLHEAGSNQQLAPPESSWSLSYEPVVQVQSKLTRPVIIFGPLKDRLNDELVSEFPDKYSSCVPHTTRPIRRGEVDGRDYHFVLSREVMEQDIRIGLFVEAGVYNDHLYGMSADAIKAVANQGKHCLLDVSTGAIPRLQAAGIHPISILIKPRSPTLISLWNQPISEEAARKVYAATVKLFQDSYQHFTAVVSADSPSEVFERVKQIIADHSDSLIWITSNEKLPTQ